MGHSPPDESRQLRPLDASMSCLDPGGSITKAWGHGRLRCCNPLVSPAKLPMEQPSYDHHHERPHNQVRPPQCLQSIVLDCNPAGVVGPAAMPLDQCCCGMANPNNPRQVLSLGDTCLDHRMGDPRRHKGHRRCAEPRTNAEHVPES